LDLLNRIRFVIYYVIKLQNTWIGRKKKADDFITTKESIEENRKQSDILIYKVWEIIDYFNPHYWFLENPLSCLKDREVMKDKPYYIVDYCKYSDWGYRKRTCIWTNKQDWEALTCNKDCENMVQDQHKKVLGNGYEMIDGKKVLCNTKELRDKLRKTKGKKHKTDCSKDIGGGSNRLERYRVPEELIYSLFLD